MSNPTAPSRRTLWRRQRAPGRQKRTTKNINSQEAMGETAWCNPAVPYLFHLRSLRRRFPAGTELTLNTVQLRLVCYLAALNPAPKPRTETCVPTVSQHERQMSDTLPATTRGQSVVLKDKNKTLLEFAAETLLETLIVKIRDVKCRGSCRHQSGEELATTTELVFPYRGVYVRHLGHDQAVAEANQVLFFNSAEG